MTSDDNTKQDLINDDAYERAREQALELLEQGFHLGGRIRVMREELHDRKS